jgi:hypothetical protein
MYKAFAVAALLLSTFALSAQDIDAQHAAKASRSNGAQIITFDPPGSLQTAPQGINDLGQVVGTYWNGVVSYGFIRDPTGVIVSFGVAGSSNTQAVAINASGETTGYYYDSSNLPHGFVRSPSGSITSFDPPGSSFTVPRSINSSGQVAGGYANENGVSFGFVRDAQGNFATVSVPGAESTGVCAISDNGSVTGDYLLSLRGQPSQGFVRDSSGVITTFVAPGAGEGGGGMGTIPLAINGNGEVTGYYVSQGHAYHGFSRDQAGVITTLDDPKAYEAHDFGTLPASVNLNGEIVGYVQNPSGYSGFTVDASLDWTSFAVPGAITGNPYAGTFPTGINNSGVVTGSYQDVKLVTHGFVRF